MKEVNLLKDMRLKSYKTNYIHLRELNLDPIKLATSITDISTYAGMDYMIYENNDEISIGIGKYLDLKVYPNKVLIKNDDRQGAVIIKDICKDIYNIFNLINMNNWRAYGMANFNYANYMYSKDIESDKKLMEFFIPDIDVRIKDEKIVVNYITEEDYLTIKNLINRYFDDETNSEKIIKDNYLEIKPKDEDYYKDIVFKAIEEIKNDKYEKVILSRKITLDRRFNLLKSYFSGRRKNTPARSYCLKVDGLEAVGFSPETIVEVNKNKTVYTFPLAGTRALYDDEDKNKKLKEELLKDPKEIAEHAVSVKLAYQELEDVCEKDSVCVIEFMNVLERGTVQHLASRLKGKIKNGMNEWHAFSALFPAVTASGIPKKECIDTINRLEKDDRGLYSGGVLTYDKDGTLDVALVLRTAFQTNEESWIRVGAGIVKLSNPKRELEETKEKLGSIVDQLVYKNNKILGFTENSKYCNN